MKSFIIKNIQYYLAAMAKVRQLCMRMKATKCSIININIVLVCLKFEMSGFNLLPLLLSQLYIIQNILYA